MWIVFILLGVSALSWVFGKMKENAEAEEAKQRARLHRQRLQEQAQRREVTGDSDAAERVPAERLATMRREQLAQLRQERLAALRAEMASRLQSASPRPSATSRSSQSKPKPSRHPPQRPTPAPPPPSQRLEYDRPIRQSAPPEPQSQSATRPEILRPKPVAPDRAGFTDLGVHAPHGAHRVGESHVHRLITDASVISPQVKRAKIPGGSVLTIDDWRRAIVLNEVLSPPVSLRDPI